jgi:SpoVK/Ycf46/Vps4 family AAA+-type ATPase
MSSPDLIGQNDVTIPSNLAIANDLIGQNDLVTALDLLLRAHYPLIYLVAAEEAAVADLLQSVCARSTPPRPQRCWDIARGWQDDGNDKNALMAALLCIDRAVAESPHIPTVYVLYDPHAFLQNPNPAQTAPIVRALKNLVQVLAKTRQTVILVSHILALPTELADVVTVLDVPLPDGAAIGQLIQQSVAPNYRPLSPLGWEQLVKACQGLSRSQIQRVLAKAIAAKQQVDETDIDQILAEKQQIIRRTGILEFFTPQESLKQVGGLATLKAWVRSRREAFSETARSYGIPNPKGLLLVGIQGTGKSLAAKTIAREWRLPLLRLDVGRLFGGLVGESESRVRQMIQLVEAVSPCVLWIDEIDKAFGDFGHGDAGTSQRVFGTLLTWMQEKTGPVFVVATANNVQTLPPELLRKGRFDEIFFLNLPTTAERQEIFRINLQRLRPNRWREFDLAQLAWQTRDFSGAEIEQVIIDGMYLAFSGAEPRRDFVTADILQAIAVTVPLAVLSREQVEGLQRWAERTGARLAGATD